MIIKQIVIFNASPHELYEAIIDAKKHSEFTKQKMRGRKQVLSGKTFEEYYGERAKDIKKNWQNTA